MSKYRRERSKTPEEQAIEKMRAFAATLQIIADEIEAMGWKLRRDDLAGEIIDMQDTIEISDFDRPFRPKVDAVEIRMTGSQVWGRDAEKSSQD